MEVFENKQEGTVFSQSIIRKRIIEKSEEVNGFQDYSDYSDYSDYGDYDYSIAYA